MDTKLVPALQGLVDAGKLTVEQAVATQQAISEQLTVPVIASSSEHVSQTSEEAHSRRAIISEALTYVGFVFVIAAAALLTNQAWESLGRWGRPALFAGGAVILFAAGLWMRSARSDASGRRLSSTLFVGAEGLTAGSVGLLLNELWVPKNAEGIDSGSIYWQEPARWVEPTIIILTAFAALIVGAGAYLLSRSALGQIAMAVPSMAMVLAFGQLIVVWTSETDQAGPPRVGFALLFLGGLLWLFLADQGYVQEKVVGQVLGVAALYTSVQGLGTDLKVWIGALGLILLGLSLLSVYLSNRAWPFLVGGIVGMFSGGVQMLVEYVHGTSGALASLALGVLMVILGVRVVGGRNQAMAVHAKGLNGNGNGTNGNDTSQIDDEFHESKNNSNTHRNVEPF